MQETDKLKKFEPIEKKSVKLPCGHKRDISIVGYFEKITVECPTCHKEFEYKKKEYDKL